jgi:hypothetical protein
MKRENNYLISLFYNLLSFYLWLSEIKLALCVKYLLSFVVVVVSFAAVEVVSVAVFVVTRSEENETNIARYIPH